MKFIGIIFMISIQSQNFHFNIPLGWKDETNYNFQAEHDKEELRIFQEKVEENSDEQMIEEFKIKMEALKSFSNNEIVIENEFNTKLGNGSARAICYRMHENGEKYYFFFGVGLDNTMQFSYRISTDYKKAQEKFEHILNSVSWNENSSIIPSQYKRYYIYEFFVDVPKELIPQKVYLFIDSTERMRIAIAEYVTNQTSPLISLIEEIRQEDIKTSDSTTFRVNKEKGKSIQYILKEEYGGFEIIDSREIQFSNGVSLHIVGKSQKDNNEELKKTIQDIIDSISII